MKIDYKIVFKMVLIYILVGLIFEGILLVLFKDKLDFKLDRKDYNEQVFR